MKTYLLLSVAIIFGCGPNSAGGAFDCTNPATCPDNASCSAGSQRCGPNKSVEQCKPDGSGWMPIGHCGDGQNCSGGQCSPTSCMGTATQCTPDGRIQMCLPTNGTYSDPAPCPAGQACVGTGCIMTVCTPNSLFCDGMQVRQCDPLGSNSSVVNTCTGNQMCANGGCLDACQAADLLKSFAGCTFYSVDMDNDDTNDPFEGLIVVANQSPTLTATVKVEVRNGAAWTTLCGPATVSAGQTHTFGLRNPPTCDIGAPPFLDRHIEDSGLAQGLAYRVTSDAPIVTYQYNSDDLYAREASSSGSSVLLPKATLGKKYYALNWPEPPAGTGSSGNHAYMTIVGTEDGTNVMVTSSTTTLVGPSVPAMNPLDQRTFVLNEGDVVQIATAGPGNDISGSFISSDKPVALFTGIECAPNPGTGGGFSCDHVEEQVLPLIAWGKNYVASRVSLSGQTNPSLWRVLASVDNTHITIQTPPGQTVTPPGPFMLNTGQVQEIQGPINTSTCTTGSMNCGHFFISADQPILVMQMAGTEAATITVVPVEQFLQKYAFQTPDIFQSVLAVTRYAGTPVLLDGSQIADSLFVDAGGGYQVALYPIPTQTGQGMVNPHTLTVNASPDGQTHPAGIQVYGEDVNCSYGYVGGLNITVINPIP
jgi:hypothetical protein